MSIHSLTRIEETPSGPWEDEGDRESIDSVLLRDGDMADGSAVTEGLTAEKSCGVSKDVRVSGGGENTLGGGASWAAAFRPV